MQPLRCWFSLQRPDLVTRLVVVAGVFHRDGWASGVLADADQDPPAFFVDNYSEVSSDGRGHYPIVAAKLARMHAEPSLTLEDLHRVTTRTLVVVGGDHEVRLEHAIELNRAVPDCELAIIPGTSHGLWWRNHTSPIPSSSIS